MPTIQIWVTDEDYRDLARLIEYIDDIQEEEFGDRAYLMGGRSGERRRKRIHRKRINPSYVFKEAFRAYWFEHEQRVKDFEKRKR